MNSSIQSMPTDTPSAVQKSSYLSHTWLRLSAMISLYFSKPPVAANDDYVEIDFGDEHEDMMNYR